jgi:hypothetical protein
MKRLIKTGTRRQLFRVLTAAVASVPLVALTKRSASAGGPIPIPIPTPPRPPAKCFLKGTKILTALGERAVQELQIGDEVTTLVGPKVVKWIGYRKFTKEEGKAWQDEVMPVRIARSALADKIPSRDLYLSPNHCIFYDEALIPVGYLVNGTSITRDLPAQANAIEYYHIEFETHQVLYAEGITVESLLDDGSDREAYANFIEYERLYGESQSKMTPFAPIVAYFGGRDEVKGLIRAVVSKVVDVRDPIQRLYDRLAERAQLALVD